MIDDVDKSLVRVLESNLTGIPAGKIAVVSPERAAEEDVWLGLFPYALVETPSLKNEPPELLGPARSRRAPLTLDVYYLMTAYIRIQASHLLLVRAMRVLHEHGVLRGGDLIGLLNGPERELHVTLNPISVEDMTRIWSAFPQQPYRISVAYCVTPVPVPLELEYSLQRVVERETRTGRLVAQGEEA